MIYIFFKPVGHFPALGRNCDDQFISLFYLAELTRIGKNLVALGSEICNSGRGVTVAFSFIKERVALNLNENLPHVR